VKWFGIREGKGTKKSHIINLDSFFYYSNVKYGKIIGWLAVKNIARCGPTTKNLLRKEIIVNRNVRRCFDSCLVKI
jgi:hypothetical protein